MYKEPQCIIKSERENSSNRDPTFNTSFRRIQSRLTEWIKNILENLEHCRDLSQDEKTRLLSLTNKAKALIRQINIKRHTLAKCNWLKFGDVKSKLFHNTIAIRKRTNLVTKLEKDNKNTLTNITKMIRAFKDHYVGSDPKLDARAKRIISSKLDKAEHSTLCQAFTLEEITRVIKELKNGKSPGQMA